MAYVLSNHCLGTGLTRSSLHARVCAGRPVFRAWRLGRASIVRAASQPGDVPPPVPANEQSTAFGKLERQIVDNLATRQPGLKDEWTEVEGCWVLSPPTASGAPKAVLHFLGGAFVGAAPQLSYRALLEGLAARGYLVVAAPYPTGFNHLRIAGQVQFKFENCMRVLGTDPSLPVYGLGHSMGSLLHLLAATQLPVQRAGNVLMSFNNKDVLDAIPFFAPLIAPGARALGPILSRLAASPLRSQVEAPLEMLRGLSPALVKQVLPILDQLLPIYMDVANGSQEFIPSPDETKRFIRSSYGIPRNLLLQFEDDTIDETAALANLLRNGSAVSSQVDLTVTVLPGDHVTPLTATLQSLPPELSAFVSQGNQFFEQLSSMASQAGGPMGPQFQEFTQGLSGLAGNFGGSSSQGEAIELLADTIDGWLQTQSSAVVRQLPASADSIA